MLETGSSSRRWLFVFLGAALALLHVATGQANEPRAYIAPGAESYVSDLVFGSLGSLNDEFRNPVGIATAPDGTLWVADTSNHRIMQFDADGNFLYSFGAFGNQNQPGQFNQPHGMAVDHQGNLWVADKFNGRVQKLDPSGQMLCAVTGLTTPEDVAAPQTGNTIFVANSGAHTVVRVNMSTCAYIGAPWGGLGSTDGLFSRPISLTVDSAGKVWVADFNNNRLQQFEPNGMFMRALGVYGSGDSRFTLSPHFYGPIGIAADTCGHIFVTEYYNHRVQVFRTDGTFVTSWGWLGYGHGQFYNPWGIAVDTAGRAYVVEYQNSRIQRFSPSTTAVTHLFKSKFGTFGNLDGELYNPHDVAVNQQNGNVYVADTSNNRIQRFDEDGEHLQTVGGACQSGDGHFCSPHGIGIDPRNGDFWVADTSNNRIQKISRLGVFKAKVGGTSAGSANNQFNFPHDVAVDAVSGDVAVADCSNHRVMIYNENGTFIRGIGQGTTWTAADPPPAIAAGVLQRWFNCPAGVFVHPTTRDIYVVESNNRRVQKFKRTGIYLGKWGLSGSGHGEFSNPAGITMHPNGQFYVADTGNSRLQTFTSTGRFITTWGSFGANSGATPAPDGLLYNPEGVAISPAGDRVYVTNTNNHRIEVYEIFGFSLSATPTLQTIVQPDVTKYTLRVDGEGANMLNTRVSFCMLPLPTDTTATFSRNSVTPDDQALVNSVLSIDTGATTPLGLHTLNVLAHGGGQIRVLPVALDLKNGPPTITNQQAAPNPFSPNGDGTKDATTITASFKVPLNWKVVINTGACPGAAPVVRQFTGGPAAALSQVWNGKNTGGATVADGDYCATITGKTPGGINAAKKTVTITVNNP